jgi:hypothetical protein
MWHHQYYKYKLLKQFDQDFVARSNAMSTEVLDQKKEKSHECLILCQKAIDFCIFNDWSQGI